MAAHSLIGITKASHKKQGSLIDLFINYEA